MRSILSRYLTSYHQYFNIRSVKFSQTVPSHNSCQFFDLPLWIQNVTGGFEDVQFVPYRLRDFRLGRSFTNSAMDIEPVCGKIKMRDAHRYLAAPAADGFKLIFDEGFLSLPNCVNVKNANPGVRMNDMLYELAGFLMKKEFHENCLREVRDIPFLSKPPEFFIAAVLANHLFSRLTMSSYFIANDYCGEFSRCPCTCKKCRDEIPFHNSGIGSELLWFGRPDIIILTNAGESNCIAMPKLDDEEYQDMEPYDDLDYEEKQIIEVKKQSQALRYHTNVSQFVAQAITFSYYQKSFQQREGMESVVTLVPFIATSGNFFDIYFYDWKHDILLRSANQISLWNEPQYPVRNEVTLNTSSLLMLWMILNHLPLKPRLSNDTVRKYGGTCGLKLPENVLEGIDKTIKMKQVFYPSMHGMEVVLPPNK